jgi:hypothetical protein
VKTGRAIRELEPQAREDFESWAMIALLGFAALCVAGVAALAAGL